MDLIAKQRNEHIDLSRIPYDDPQTYEMIQTAETMGVFQIESRAQMQSLLRTRPETLDDITVQVAIVRPGPIQGGAVNPYIERRQRLREDPGYQVPYEHPSLEPVLKDTLGTIIFQDQVLEVATAFAGFSAGEAEGLRRAMSRKRSDAAIRAHHDRFITGALATHGVEEEAAERVWQMIKGFSGFGFPKAHGAAFGLLAYQSTWLRVHYFQEFLCALLNEQPMGFYPPDQLAHEAQRRGIALHPPEVNASDAECTVEGDGAIRIGLAYVKGVKADEVAALVAARRDGGAFTSASDLAARAAAGRPALAQLAWAGACDALSGGDRRRALWQLGVAVPGTQVNGGVQLSLPLDLPAAPELRELSRWDAMLADYATTSVTLNDHPLGLLRPDLPAGTASSQDLHVIDHGTRVQVAGMVVARQRPSTANGIVFLLLEDEFGTTNLIVPSRVYEQNRLTIRTEPLVIAARQARAPPGRRGRGERAGLRGPRARGARPADGRGPRLLDVGRARARAPGGRGRGGGVGLPRRGAPGAQLRVGAPALGSLAMAKLIYSAIASLDGYVADRDGRFDWAAPGEEVHAFVNDLERPIGTHLYGRRMYEVMVFWEGPRILEDPEPVMRDFAQIWQAAEKVVYSTTLESVSSARTRIERSFDPDAVRSLKEQAQADISVGGPRLAGHAIAAGLVDEYHLFLVPAIVGGGTRALPDDVRLDLELLDERRFADGAVHLHYRARR